jgi:hypothetical protein
MDQEKLQTVAHLTAAGKSVRQIEALTGISKSVAHKYRNTDEAGRLINELRPAIAARLSERMWDMIDGEAFKPKPQELAVMWGIAMDKHQKAEAPQTSNPTLVIVIPGINQPDTIQGELA